jgi:pimeloyl-ACP methyl ester carboxylesterase
MRNRPFRIEHFAENVIDYLDAHSLVAADMFGYSMGGYVALYLADIQGARVGRIATLGTKFDWSPQSAARETRMLDPEAIRAKVPAFANALEARHTAAGWKNVLERTAEMMTELGENKLLDDEQLGGVEHRVRIGIGDRDRMVSIEESLWAYRALPNGELEVMPSTPHPIEQVSTRQLAHSIETFFTT